MILQNLKKLWYLEEGLPKEEGRFRDMDKIVDVEATSWEVPRPGGELYNA